jgi:translation initiation factor IF-2
MKVPLMSDSQEKDKNTLLRVSTPGKLSLAKPLEGSRIQQSFSHGRTKTVAVEVRKTRTIQRDESGKIVEVSRAAKPAAKEAPAPVVAPKERVTEEKQLTNEELQMRRRVLERASAAKSGEEHEREEERLQRESLIKRRQVETPAAPAVEAVEEKVEKTEVVRREEKEKEKPRSGGLKKKSDDFEEEIVTSKKPAKKRRRSSSDDPASFDIEELDTKSLLKISDEEMIVPRHSALLDDADDFEDYTEDTIPPSEDEIVGLVRPADESRSKVVRAIQSSERIIIAPADPFKTRKYLRSDAPTEMSPRLRRLQEPAKAPETPAVNNRGGKKRRGAKQQVVASTISREVTIPENIIISELADRMAVRSVDVIKSLMKMGMMLMPSQSIDADTAELVVSEFGHTPLRVTEADVETALFGTENADSATDLTPRAPVVTIMGHVDHGKTSLLDTIRATNVVSGEAGGITQHIGAYQVTTADGHKISFIDTPGHEAFTAMRARGAKVTDIVVLVVAADDGVKPQTVEAINHAKAAGVPIIVAVNKIDKPDADPSRVRNELMQYELVTEEFGGEVIAVDVSAKQKLNIDKLLESILVQAEVLELTANADAPASGTVIEARIEKGRGVVATMLVQRGTMRVGDIVVAGATYGNVRALVNDQGAMIKEAGPCMPVEVLGLDQVPNAGDSFAVATSDRQAREITDYRQGKERELRTGTSSRLTLEDLFTNGRAKVKELAVILKGDVQGSVEAIIGSLEKIDSSEVKARVIHHGVGAITVSDVALANASNAIILAFNVRANAQAKEAAARDKIAINYYSIIYDLVDNIKLALSGMLAPSFKEVFLGYAEIRQIFNMSKAGKVAGCMVTQGTIKRASKVRLLRDNVVIHEGVLKTLKRFKEDVKDVREGFECGMAFENYEDLREGDQIEAFELEQVTRSI